MLVGPGHDEAVQPAPLQLAQQGRQPGRRLVSRAVQAVVGRGRQPRPEGGQLAGKLGALGATISGAGPAVLVWCSSQSSGDIAEKLRSHVGDSAEVRPVPFSSRAV
ncbi:MAG: hypothetical protein IH806_00910 [Proteobacteria bacterium]|nr:hypothetical protein [Pseudomonadota bacterium]